VTLDLTKYTIRYWCDLNPGTGFNNATRGILRALKTLGLDSRHIHLAPAVLAEYGSTDEDLNDWVYPYVHRASANDIVCDGELRDDAPEPWSTDKERINIVHLTPGMLAGIGYCTFVGGYYNIAVTAWETDALQIKPLNRNGKSVTVVEALNDYDEVWVPTEWNATMFKRCGVTKPIFVIPHVLLPELLSTPLTRRPDGAQFYTMGTWNPRKDHDTLLQTYLQAGWTPLDDVDLQIYSLPPTRAPMVIKGHQMRAEASRERILDAMADPTAAAQHGLHTARYEAYSEVVTRHQRGNVFVSASHGEGFCLPALEAAAVGNWVIGGGPWIEELARVAGDVEDGGLIDVLPTDIVPITPMPEAAGYELGQKWWSVRPERLLLAMRDAADALNECSMGDSNTIAASYVRDAYGPDDVGKMLRERLTVAHEVLDGSSW